MIAAPTQKVHKDINLFIKEVNSIPFNQEAIFQLPISYKTYLSDPKQMEHRMMGMGQFICTYYLNEWQHYSFDYERGHLYVNGTRDTSHSTQKV
jgi:hypothetical protein